MVFRQINPPDLAVPKGYSHGVLSDVGTRMLAVAGQIGWDSSGKMVGEDIASQFRQALRNVGSVVKAAGGNTESILRLTIFVTDKNDYLRNLESIGKDYRGFVGKHNPAMTLIVVKDLLEPGAKVEVEATAALGEKAGQTEFVRHGSGGMFGDAPLRRNPGVPPPGKKG